MSGAIHWPPTAVDLAQFLDAFWPELLATVLGVALGLPAAWFIERTIRETAEREDRARDAETLREACAALAASVERNLDHAKRLESTLSQERVPVASGLEAATFGMVRDDIARLLSDLALRVFIARWFDRICQIDRLVDHGVAVEAAPRRIVPTVGSKTLDLTEGLRKRIAATALSLVEALIVDAPELQQKLERAVQAPPTEGRRTAGGRRA